MSEGKIRLRENFARDWNDNVLPLQVVKENRIVEAEGKEYSVDKKFIVPVWKLGEANLNGRKYPRELGEKIVRESPKTVNLADHPEDEGSVRDIIAVSMNPFIKDNILYTESYFVDSAFEEKLERMLEKGVGMGVSSSGFGEVDKEGRVDESTYEIERMWDAVVSPSFQVYITKESVQEENTNEQLIQDQDTNIVQETENTDESEDSKIGDAHDESPALESLKEKTTMSDEKKKPTLEEKNLRIGVRNLMKEAEAKEDLYEQRKAYEEVLDYCNGEDAASEFIEQANEAIKEIDSQIQELANKGREADTLKEGKETAETKLQEKEEEIKSLREQLEQLTEKYEVATKMLDESKDRDAKLKEMYQVAVAERNGMVKASDYKELYTYTEQKEEEADQLRKELRDAKRKLRQAPRAAARRKESVEDEEDEKDSSEERTSTLRERKRPTRRNRGEEKRSREQDVEEEDEPVQEKGEYDFTENERVREYYEDLVAYNPEVKRLKKYILGAKTVMEAQRAYLDFKDLIEDIPAPGSRRFEVEGVDNVEHRTDVEMPDGNRMNEGSAMDRILRNRKSGWV